MEQFKNMKELVEYLQRLEERVSKLEAENHSLRSIQTTNEPVNGNMIIKYASRLIPQTSLFSPNFLTRAFTVWGHFMAANFLVSAVFMVIYFCLLAVGLSSVLGTLPQN